MKGTRPRIMINGFYGAGNSGDEAMLRNFYFHVRRRLPDAEILVATEKPRGLWEQADLHYVNGMDRAKAQECDLLVIGGGHLGPGFGWNLIPHAKIPCHGKNITKVVSMSMNYDDLYLNDTLMPLSREILKLHDLIYVRSRYSVHVLKKMGIDSLYTTDMAVDLPEVPIDFHKPDNMAVVVVREVHPKRELEALNVVHLVLKALEKDYNVILLPFCREDEMLCRKVQDAIPYKITMISTLDPQQHKYIINRSDCLISLGRFHALVYATEQGVPTIACSYPFLGSKINYWMEDLKNKNYCFHIKRPIINSECFKEVLQNLMDNRDKYRARMLKQHQNLVSVNNQQFDNIIKLIT